jgi:hypothetical protein
MRASRTDDHSTIMMIRQTGRDEGDINVSRSSRQHSCFPLLLAACRFGPDGMPCWLKQHVWALVFSIVSSHQTCRNALACG